jgi:hypothetical protein
MIIWLVVLVVVAAAVIRWLQAPLNQFLFTSVDSIVSLDLR